MSLPSFPDWCNVNGAGFGKRPTAETDLDLLDAFVWVKPGGESDGTSDSSAVRYDSFCGKDDGKGSSFPPFKKTKKKSGTSTPVSNRTRLTIIPTAFKPSPEAGQWNQAYFEMLLRNANPPF